MRRDQLDVVYFFCAQARATPRTLSSALVDANNINARLAHAHLGSRSWRLGNSTLCSMTRLRRKRLAKQAAGGHLVNAKDYVDAVYMALAAAAHAQANAACDALVWNPPHGSGRRRLGGLRKPRWLHALSPARLVDAEDYVDAVYMVLAAAAHTHASAALCSA